MRIFALLRNLHRQVSRLQNTQRTRKVAQTLFPSEKWIKVESYIWAAQSRLVERAKEREKWEKEISQVRILTHRGSVVYFLPEKKNEDKGQIYADDAGCVSTQYINSSRQTTVGRIQS
jgi:hypothetical protein